MPGLSHLCSAQGGKHLEYDIASHYGWPEPYVCTVYDRIFGNFPAKNTVYTPNICGSGQPYKSRTISDRRPSGRNFVRTLQGTFIRLARIIHAHVHTVCIYGIQSREITNVRSYTHFLYFPYTHHPSTYTTPPFLCVFQPPFKP
jgi:hypothetical protein